MVIQSPQGITRYSDQARVPKIRINVKKKRNHMFSHLGSPNSYILKLDDSQISNSRPQYPFQKKFKTNLKKQAFFVFEDLPLHKNDPEQNLTPVPEISQIPQIDYLYSGIPQKSISPKAAKTPIKKHTNISVGLDLGLCDSFPDKIPSPVLPFPITFKAKKSSKKNSTSLCPSSAYEKYFPNSEKDNTERLGKILKFSNTPNPEKKTPKYIRHESYKAGYFLSKIDKFLSRIRVYRSKSSLNGRVLPKQKLKTLVG
ncbi:hypothetical protein SteCoe_23179 [Stentor coeruleus]|uniref:Uncharacterized protein n=1 Tax=Stentor coeruleus TaxID=5963 RepID=A0A1R2BH30_9CILI|nr:hypothetical protein SteCoe_24707 [Stentor coeruleus]OMJ77270.1 hypothetical protein SteCoe_23179 [Stentor coeruleus]